MRIELASSDLLTLLGPEVSQEVLKNLEHCSMEVSGSSGLLKKMDDEINDKIKKIVNEAIKDAVRFTKNHNGTAQILGWASNIFMKEVERQVATIDIKTLIRESCETEMKYFMENTAFPRIEKTLSDAIDRNIKNLCRQEFKDKVQNEFEIDTLEPLIKKVLRDIMSGG